MVIPARELAALDQAQARCEEALAGNAELFRERSAELGSGEALMGLCIELGRQYTTEQLGSMLAVAIARLAREKS